MQSKNPKNGKSPARPEPDWRRAAANLLEGYRQYEILWQVGMREAGSVKELREFLSPARDSLGREVRDLCTALLAEAQRRRSRKSAHGPRAD